MDAAAETVNLREDVLVDLDELQRWAARVLGGVPRPPDLIVPARCSRALDLLPGWYDDWIVVERERLRHHLLHALEALSGWLSARRRHAEAVEAAMTAVCADPLRESAQRVLILAHAAEGNLAEARRAFDRFTALLRRELDVEPSPDLAAAAHEFRSVNPRRGPVGRRL